MVGFFPLFSSPMETSCVKRGPPGTAMGALGPVIKWMLFLTAGWCVADLSFGRSRYSALWWSVDCGWELPHGPQLSQGAARGLCISAADTFSLPGQPSRAWGLSPACASCRGRKGPVCHAEPGRAGGRWYARSYWEPAERKTSKARSLGCCWPSWWQGAPACLHCAFLTSHLSVLLL